MLDESRETVKLIDVALARVAKTIPLSEQNGHLFMLSEDEKRLFYAYGLPPAEEQAFHVLDFENGQDQLLFSTSSQEWLQPVAEGASTDHVLLLRAPDRVEQPTPTQLLLAGTSPGEPTIVTTLSADELVTSALLCQDNRVLMTVSSKGQTEVRLWEPNGSIKSLLKTDQQLQLLSCR